MEWFIDDVTPEEEYEWMILNIEPCSQCNPECPLYVKKKGNEYRTPELFPIVCDNHN